MNMGVRLKEMITILNIYRCTESDTYFAVEIGSNIDCPICRDYSCIEKVTNAVEASTGGSQIELRLVNA